MLIDAHQHFWQIGRDGHEWPTADLRLIHRDFGLDDWRQVATPLGISGSVLVQAQPNDQETDWLIRVAEASPSIKAVVGWVDLKGPAAAGRVAEVAKQPKLKGLRPMLQALPSDWIADPALDPAIAAMIAHGLRFDALVFTEHLPHLRAFAERWPELPVVIDHCAKPPIARAQLEPWRTEMARLAQLPNVLCKLSGLFNEMAPGQERMALEPYVRHLGETFGPERLMWGSDWPVILLAGSFEEWLHTATKLSGFDGSDLASLLGGTAARFYGF